MGLRWSCPRSKQSEEVQCIRAEADPSSPTCATTTSAVSSTAPAPCQSATECLSEDNSTTEPNEKLESQNLDDEDTFPTCTVVVPPLPSAVPDMHEVELQVATETSSEKVAIDSAATAQLVAAVESEEWDAAVQLLRAGGCDVHARTSDWGYSLLRAAAEEGALEVCRQLLAQRADVNARDGNGMTALMGCVVGGDNGELVSLLLEARADPAVETDDSFTALRWATRLHRDQAIALLRSAGMIGETSPY